MCWVAVRPQAAGWGTCISSLMATGLPANSPLRIWVEGKPANEVGNLWWWWVATVVIGWVGCENACNLRPSSPQI